jgi:CheY-like chemotaxis protein
MSLSARDPLYKNFTEIGKAAHRAEDLVRQLLAYSRKQALEPKVLDLNLIITEMEEILQRLIGEDIELKTLATPNLWKVMVDPIQIEQVIVNLAVNARDAMPGGGKLSLETANVELNEEYTRSHPGSKAGPYVMLAVSDTGCGMSEEVREHIFDPFFTTKEVGKGTGLGLSTVYGIIKQSGGNIWVYSEEGQGTSFKIYLPKVEGEAVPSFRKIVTDEVPGGHETILIVEDEQIVRELAVKTLKNLGYKVYEAQNGEDAYLLAKQLEHPVDLVISDIVMPNMSGMDLGILLRSKVWSDVKILYISGYTENIRVQQDTMGEGGDYLQKPFRPSSLAQKVREVLDKK